MRGQPTKNAPDLLFPRDEGRHVDALHEWWYLNSHLETNTGRHYGLFVLFFPNSMYLTLVDKLGKYVVKRIVSYETVKTSTSHLNLETGNNWWRQVPGRPFHYAMHLHEDDLSLSLDLLPRKPPLFVNHSGCIREGLLGTSKYYALTNMKVSGTLQLNQNEFDVRGIGWIDRQWGSWDFGGIGSWDWFSIQLSNNVEILVAQILHPITTRPTMRTFNMMDNEGRTKVYDKFRVECLKTWKSPRTGSVYGVEWKVSLPQDTNLLISPVFEDQEIHGGLWEGCCEVKGILHGQRVNGVCYAEHFYNLWNYFARANYFRLISLGTAPLHYIGQRLLGRVDFNVWRLLFSILRKLRARAG